MEDDEEHRSQLELRLGPPSCEERTIKSVSENNPILETGDSVLPHRHWIQFPQIQTRPQKLSVTGDESSQPCDPRAVSANADVPNSSQKRVALASVVGWPPIRSRRKNLASGILSKANPETQKLVPNPSLGEEKSESCKKGLFVKINMDGVPIGRKVNLRAYDSYEKLSTAVDDLFRGLVAAQGGTDSKQVGEKAILDGSGEYTLVYEDNEGDRLLVGDVPWDMFVSAVKRLRVLKRSELSKLSVIGKQEDC